MPSVTYYVVVSFTRDGNGDVVPGEAKEAPNGEAARRQAASVAAAAGDVGTVAFQRVGDPDSGELQESVVLASVGEVNLAALQG